MKQYKFVIIVAIILFFVPFFWLKPGEMNLGGDSGRLYFYDPASYLNLHVLYDYLGSGFGVELTYYIYLPYVVFLFLLKLILQSPTILISFFNGITLSVAFFSIYLILKEFLKEKENAIKSAYVEFSSVLAGLFYVLSQISIYSGWEKPTVSFNQIFLNPFMVFLLLKFMLTQKIRYLILALFTTLIFTPNFSIVGAPPFFAFYPITIVFLFLYAKFVRKVTFRWKLFVIGITLFLLMHSFQLINTVGSVFSPGSAYNQTVFAKEGEMGSRNGLTYFISVAGTVKTSRIWLGLSQFQDNPYLAVFIILPLSLAISFFLNRGKTLLLTGLFFLIFFYLASSITETGFFIYKQFFRIPGFSIFRNFHGQWSYVFFFFYALLLGQALAIVANRLSKRITLLFFTIFGAIIIGFGLPLLTGSVPMPIREDTGDRHVFRMDSFIEQALQYFRSEPIDGRVLMLPLTGAGYQIFQGKDGGIYKGLPMISYLGGKSEFGGYETLRPFQDIFMTSMKNNDYENLKKLFSMLNIKWVFYNSDPYIYSEPFASVYSVVSEYAPKDQGGYKAFIEKLPVTKLTDFSDRYHLYSVNNDIYFPHIFATDNMLYSNDQMSVMFDSNFQKNTLQLISGVESAKANKDPMIIYGMPRSFLVDIHDNSHLHKHMPFLNKELSNPLYPFVVFRENFDLMRFKNNPSQYIDYSLFLLSKRIAELNTYGLNMPLVSQESRILEIDKWFSYNSWNTSFIRYEKGLNEIINWINSSKFSYEDKMYNKIKVNEQLSQHELSLLRIIYDLNKKDSEKKYLLSYINNMFTKLYKKVDSPFVNPYLYSYKIDSFSKREGDYEILFQNDLLGQNQEQTIKIGNKILKSPFTDIHIDSESKLEADIIAPIPNLAVGQKWNNSGIPIEESDGFTILELNNKLGDLTSGLTLEISNWTAKNTYLISFDYKTYGDDFVFSFVGKTPNDSVKKFVDQSYFEKRLNAQNFKTSQSVVFAGIKSIEGFLKIVPFSPKDTSRIQIKNLVIKKIEYPKLIFKKIVPEESKKQSLPNLTFRKVNPTRYLVNIKGAENPYTLVFLEAFNQNWKLFNPQSNTDSLKGEIGRFFGKAGKSLISLFVKDKSDDIVVASYFNGKVEEGASTNKFLDSKTFDTWGKNTILDKEHITVNSYANAWYIRPEDMGGKKDYTLILELKTQKQFYLTLLISLITVVSILLYLVKKFLWKKK